MQETKNRDQFLTPTDAAGELGVPRSTLYGLVKTGKLVSYRIIGTNRILISKRDIAKFKKGIVVVEKVQNPNSTPRSKS